MLKIFFYHANDTLGFTKGKEIFLSVASLYLKTFIDSNKPSIANDIKWLTPQQEKLTDDELISKIEKEQPDIFCTSHYIWNNTFISAQIERIKPRLKKQIIFVAGGPSIDVNINNNFFQEHPSIDYALYGAGESGFADLLESIILNKKLIKFNTSNIGWLNDGVQVVADFKYVPQLPISPYTNNVGLFTSMTKDLLDKNYFFPSP